MIIKAYKYRIYPTIKQSKVLNQNFGATRFIWNELVANFNNYGTEDHIQSMSEVHIRKNNTWLKNCISVAIQQKRVDFYETCKQFFNKKRKAQLGRMKFKKKGVCNNSFRVPGQSIRVKYAFNFESGKIKLPKISPMKIKYDRVFIGEVRSITVSRTKTNEYYVSVLVREEILPKERTYKDIGIDLGLNHLVILSDGTKFENPKYFRENQSKLKKAQQHLARKLKGSASYNKQKLKVAKCYSKVTRQRTWYYHQISNYLINKYDSIFVENLGVKNMMKNHKLAKSIQDASWSTLVSIIEYKAKWNGKELKKIDRFFASSKLCSSCGYKNTEIGLSVRDWICPSCGINHDRDINAAKNIYQEGMKTFYGLLDSEELPEYSRGEDISPNYFCKKVSANFDETIKENTNIKVCKVLFS